MVLSTGTVASLSPSVVAYSRCCKATQTTIRYWKTPKSGVTKRPPFLLKRYLSKRLPSHVGYAWPGRLLPHQRYLRVELTRSARGHSRLSPCAWDKMYLASETLRVGCVTEKGYGSGVHCPRRV